MASWTAVTALPIGRRVAYLAGAAEVVAAGRSPTGWASRRAGWTRSSGVSGPWTRCRRSGTSPPCCGSTPAVLLGRDVQPAGGDRAGRGASSGSGRRCRRTRSPWVGRRRGRCRAVGGSVGPARSRTRGSPSSTPGTRRWSRCCRALLADAQRAHAGDRGAGRAAAGGGVPGDRVAAGEARARRTWRWLAADRAMAAADR